MKLDRVFLVWRPWAGPYHLEVARTLQARGASIHLYTARAGGAEAVARRAPGLFTSHKGFQVIYDAACAPDRGLEGEIARALEHECWLGKPFGHLAIADRHLGRGFALGGGNFPRSRPSRATRAQMLAAFSTQIEFWRREIECLRPDVLIDADTVLNAVADAVRVPVRVLAASRHANLYYWAHDSFLRSPEILASYNAIDPPPAAVSLAPGIEQATPMVTYWRTAMKSTTLANFVRRSAYQVAQRAWHGMKGTDTGNVYDLMETIRYRWRVRRNSRLMTGPGMHRLAELKGARVVYFPLATEPEMTLQGLSPEYFFQLETIAAIARDLPADVVLAVKEHHPACGARDDGFYGRIEKFKNVVMLDMREPGLEVIRQADVTVTIAGSAGFEAATMGKPTIVLGRNNIYDFLDHVRVVTDIMQMRSALDDAFSGRLAGPAGERDGNRFLEAMKAISFDVEKFDPFARELTVTEASVAGAVAALERSLEWI